MGVVRLISYTRGGRVSGDWHFIRELTIVRIFVRGLYIHRLHVEASFVSTNHPPCA